VARTRHVRLKRNIMDVLGDAEMSTVQILDVLTSRLAPKHVPTIFQLSQVLARHPEFEKTGTVRVNRKVNGGGDVVCVYRCSS
jgi:hypothetical protein